MATQVEITYEDGTKVGFEADEFELDVQTELRDIPEKSTTYVHREPVAKTYRITGKRSIG